MRLSLLRAVLLLAGAAALPGQTALRGVNIAGAEFGEGVIPGSYNTHYTFNSEPTFAYFAEQGLPLLRVPIRWERIQPEPFGELDEAYFSRLKGNIAWARAHGARILVDVHNYGRYKLEEGGSRNEYLLDNSYGGTIKVSSEALIDLWLRLSAEFRDESAVYGYGLMNEPHDMGAADWKAISQSVLTAIRAGGDLKTIFVGGDSWSSAERWQQTHGPQSWISDPANNFLYEAHLYFDQDASGRYFQSFDQELAANPDLLQIGRRRLQPFRDWCEANGVRCFVGEYGVPSREPGWLDVLDNLLTAMDEAGMGGTYWAAGDWWGDYPLSVHPTGGQDKPQLAALQAHGGPMFATTVSAASFVQGVQAPESLVSAYGADFAAAAFGAEALPLPYELAGVRVEVALFDGSIQPAQVVFVSPGQINYLLPPGLPPGAAELRIYRNGNAIAVEPLTIAPAAPALFAANGQGTGAPAGQILHVGADGARELEPLAEYDPVSATFSPRPIELHTPGERIFLILYGTGFRNLPGAHAASILIDGAAGAAIAYIGPQPDFPGLDQVNVELSRDWAGAGPVTVQLSIDGMVSNELVLQIQ